MKSEGIKFETIFPFVAWFRHYSGKDLASDMFAGLTVVVVLIPQVMAFASLAGLPPVYGLYASLAGTAAAALWGSSRHLSTGPAALISFLILTTLIPFAKPESPKYITLAIILTLMIGVIQILMGLFRLGFLMNFVSHSVIGGFTTAAAIIIAATQVPSLLGFGIEKHDFVVQNLYEIVTSLGRTHLYSAAIGLIGVSLIIFSKKKISKYFPAQLVVMVLGIALSFAFDFEGNGFKVLGKIDAELSPPSIPYVSFSEVVTLIPNAIIIAVIGFLQTFAISASISKKTKQKTEVNQELIGQGIGNLASGLFKGFTISGSFARTAVNLGAGAVSGMSSVFASLFVLLTILVFTKYLYFLPTTLLAAIVIAALVDLIEFGKFRETYNLSGSDGIVITVTFLFAFLTKPDTAIFVGMATSLILFLRKTVSVQIPELHFDFDEESFDLVALPNVHRDFPEILIIRIDMSVYFGNVHGIRERIFHMVEERGPELKHLVISFGGVNYFDVSACDVFNEMFDELNKKGIKIYTMYRKHQVENIMRASGIEEKTLRIRDIKGFKAQFIIQRNPGYLV
ncbi:MAG: SulP family inorganic anion transporter [Pyrinomonadaceae bacterium]